jgi:hypothetical protein
MLDGRRASRIIASVLPPGLRALESEPRHVGLHRVLGASGPFGLRQDAVGIDLVLEAAHEPGARGSRDLSRVVLRVQGVSAATGSDRTIGR